MADLVGLSGSLRGASDNSMLLRRSGVDTDRKKSVAPCSARPTAKLCPIPPLDPVIRNPASGKIEKVLRHGGKVSSERSTPELGVDRSEIIH